MPRPTVRPLVAGNWKMNGTRDGALALAGGVAERVAGLASGGGAPEIAVFPPFVHVGAVARLLEGSAVATGAQDVAHLAPGALTGEVAAEMLIELGCRFAIVGHSERRALLGETDARVAEKFARAHEAGLVPVLCVGESLAEREAGRTEAVVARQLDAVRASAGAQAFAAAVLAYEPVWAIGTGRTATPEQAQAVHAFLRARLAETDAGVAGRLRILYGGSVNPHNARELFACEDIDGGLVGGASLDAAGFAAICEAAGG